MTFKQYCTLYIVHYSIIFPALEIHIPTLVTPLRQPHTQTIRCPQNYVKGDADHSLVDSAYNPPHTLNNMIIKFDFVSH
jgi:hypothetical protein